MNWRDSNWRVADSKMCFHLSTMHCKGGPWSSFLWKQLSDDFSFLLTIGARFADDVTILEHFDIPRLSEFYRKILSHFRYQCISRWGNDQLAGFAILRLKTIIFFKRKEGKGIDSYCDTLYTVLWVSYQTVKHITIIICLSDTFPSASVNSKSVKHQDGNGHTYNTDKNHLTRG